MDARRSIEGRTQVVSERSPNPEGGASPHRLPRRRTVLTSSSFDRPRFSILSSQPPRDLRTENRESRRMSRRLIAPRRWRTGPDPDRAAMGTRVVDARPGAVVVRADPGGCAGGCRLRPRPPPRFGRTPPGSSFGPPLPGRGVSSTGRRGEGGAEAPCLGGRGRRRPGRRSPRGTGEGTCSRGIVRGHPEERRNLRRTSRASVRRPRPINAGT